MSASSYERLKASLAKNGVQRQILLIPEIVELDEATVERLLARAEGICVVRACDRILRPPARSRCARRPRCSAGPTRADYCAISPSTWKMGRSAAAGAPPDARRRHHGLPRLGPRRRRLKPEEMNALLREMEDTRTPANAITAGRPMWN